MELVPPARTTKIAIVGTGVIGSGWAAIFAARGYAVTAYVRSAQSEAKFVGFLQVAWRKLVMRKLATNADGWKAVAMTQNLADCVSNADYVQESVVEEIALKQSIIAQIDALADPNVLIGSSTSYLPLSLVRARARVAPERVAIVHPTLPQWDDFLEVLGSCPEHSAWLAAFFGREHVGMDVIVLRKEMHGHVHNFLLECTAGAAIGLVKGGVTSAAEVDCALCHMARIILSSGGLKGALVGMVGNGDEQAYVDLSTDIMIGGPTAVSACMLSWCLPAWLARCCLSVLTFVASMYTNAAWLKRLARRLVAWMAAEFVELWREQIDKDSFEKTALTTMGRLVELTPTR